ncbi:RagB/SusD family nutrient uptake outer membrane protein [Bacteroides uniformis]|uniref:RagB/SusD family nutrient uptake outer membrane protein n=1 Tax=Bacteroides uniformis TaxID=820 RepID=UPI0039B562B2
MGTNVLLSGDAGTNWSSIYTTINSANLILKHTPEISFTNEATRNEVMANAYFLRAYCYFTLVRVFGDCPLLTSGFESEKQEDMYPSRTAASEVYAQVETDIEEALRLMPASSKLLHKASPAAINMLRTEYYLWKAKRLGGGNAALSTAQSSVDAVLKAGYALLPTFADIFNLNNEANSELIWTLPYIVNENVTPGTSPNFFAYYLAPNGDRTRLREAGYTEDEVPAGSHAQYVVPTQAYCDFLAEDARDTRTDVSVRVFEDKFLTEEVQIKRMVVKFKGSFANDTRSFDSDVPVYRLAEAYLLKAEAENALGNTDAALQNLNVVAKRAYGVDNYYTARTQDAIDNAIISEILKEFVAESKAWWAYLRFNKEFELIETLKGREGEKNVTLWPIAPACLNTNPNITQTEGYK